MTPCFPRKRGSLGTQATGCGSPSDTGPPSTPLVESLHAARGVMPGTYHGGEPADSRSDSRKAAALRMPLRGERARKTSPVTCLTPHQESQQKVSIGSAKAARSCPHLGNCGQLQTRPGGMDSRPNPRGSRVTEEA